MSESTSIVIQAAELLTTKPFELITAYFKNKREEKKAFMELLTDACFETQLEINNLKQGQKINDDRMRVISKYWSRVFAELMISYPPISNQFHAKAVSWASVNSWSEADIKSAEK